MGNFAQVDRIKFPPDLAKNSNDFQYFQLKLMKNAKNSRNEIQEENSFSAISDKQRHKISLISYVVPSHFLVIKPF